MKVAEILQEECTECWEEVYVDENGNILTEGKSFKDFGAWKTAAKNAGCRIVGPNKDGEDEYWYANKKGHNVGTFTKGDGGTLLDSALAEGELTEGATRQWKRIGKKLVRKYRCTSGKKKGKLVKGPGECGKRKEPKKVRTGRKVMRSKKGIIQRKSKIAKRQSISRLVTKLNARLMGKDVKPKKPQKHKTMS